MKAPWWTQGVWANGQRPDISERPSLMARYALLAMATVTSTVRDAHGDMDVAECWMARARRRFREAMWADDALYGDAR